MIENTVSNRSQPFTVALTGGIASGKTLIVELLSRGLESYSKSIEGRRFKFSWVFEKSWVPGKVNKGILGFSCQPKASDQQYPFYSS